MRLIDADELRHSHCVECTLYPDKCLGKDCDWGSIYHIDHAPTVEIDEDMIIEYCRRRCLVIMTAEMFAGWAERREK